MTVLKSQNGFTLIELLIVVLIIGILASIAIPVFNGQKTKSKNAVTQSATRKALTAANSAFTLSTNDGSSQTFNGMTLSDLNAEEKTISATQASVLTPGKDADPQRSIIYNYAGTTAGAGDASGIIICNVSQGDSVYCIKQATNNGAGSSVRYAQRKNVAAGVLAADDTAFSSNAWQN